MDKIIWHFVKLNSAESFVLTPGNTGGHYSALETNIEGTTFRASLKLSDFDEYDIVNVTYLEVENDVGRSIIDFSLILERDLPDDPDPIGPDGPGINKGVIIGISIAVGVVVLATVGVSIWYCKANLLYCFAPSG